MSTKEQEIAHGYEDWTAEERDEYERWLDTVDGLNVPEQIAVDETELPVYAGECPF